MNDFIKPIFSELVPLEAVAKALIRERARCNQRLKFSEALEYVNCYKENKVNGG